MFRHVPALAANSVSVSGSNLTWVVIVAVIGLLALGVAGALVREVLAAGQGTQRMQEIARAVQEGAAAYLRRQFRTLGVFVVIIFFVLLVLPVTDGGASALGPQHLLPGRRAVLGADRVHRHVADASAATSGWRPPRVRAASGPRSGSRSAPAAWPACSPSAWACSARRSWC